MNFNKVCELEDFADPEMVAAIRDVCAHKAAHFPDTYPAGYEARKDWEVAMSVRALRHFGALGPEALVLGVAAGTEDTIFYLTHHARQVFVTDRYLGAGAWGPVAPIAMLVDPSFLAPFDFDPNRLVVQHMDARCLRYPDETFDAVFSSGSIEHFGELADVAHAAYEMGRVLKPGGILALSTEFRISGPPGGIGWPGDALMLSAENLQRYVVEASGLEPVDDLQTRLSKATMATLRDITTAQLDHDRRLTGVGGRGVPEYAHWDFPHILMSHGGYEFGSVHLTLRRPTAWPAIDNEWARPPKQTLDSISARNAEVITFGEPQSASEEQAGSVPDSIPDPSREPHPVPVEQAGAEPALPPIPPLPELAGSWDDQAAAADTVARLVVPYRQAAGAVLGGVHGLIDQTRRELEEISRGTAEVDEYLSATARVRTDVACRPRRASVDQYCLNPPQGAVKQASWKSCRANLGGAETVVVVVDRSSDDPISAALIHGEPVPSRPLIDLMLSLTQPGDVVVDLGAHVGTFALAAAAAGRQVVPVEASPANAALLRASFAANGFRDLRVINAAVGDTPGTVDFWSHGPWGHVATPAHDVVSEPVLAVTVDELLPELGFGSAQFVKMDIEGFEVATLRGMRRLLEAEDAPPVLYESNGHTLDLFGETPEGLATAFAELGYTSYRIEPFRLIRVDPGVMQPETLVDCLALKKRPKNMSGWEFTPPLSLNDRVQRMVVDCTTPNPHHRAFVARRLRSETPDVVSHPSLATTLEALMQDPVDVVRDAASWLRSP